MSTITTAAPATTKLRNRNNRRRKQTGLERQELQAAMLQVEHNMCFQAALSVIAEGQPQAALATVPADCISDRSQPELKAVVKTLSSPKKLPVGAKKPAASRRRQSSHQPNLLAADFSKAVHAVAIEVSWR